MVVAAVVVTVEGAAEAAEVKEAELDPDPDSSRRRRLPRHLPPPRMRPRGGPTSRGVRTHRHCPVVKNITNLGKMLIGVRSQRLARGRTFGYQEMINEIQTSLRK